MSRNGSGTYSLPAGNPVVTGTTISSTWANNTLSDIATALTQSIAIDGQTTPTANLPMGGFKHTGVAVGSALTDYARYDQMQNSAAQWLTSVTGTDTITASASVTPASYVAGQAFRFVAAGSNTTTSVTLNINGLGAKSITKLGSTALAIGDIPSGSVVNVVYDGVQFQLVATLLTPGSVGATQIASGAVGSAKMAPLPNAAGTDTYTATMGFTSYVDGQPVLIHVPNANTITTPSLNCDSLGAKTIVLQDGSAVSSGQVVGPCLLQYDQASDKMQLANPKSVSFSSPVRQTVLSGATTSGLPSALSVGTGLAINLSATAIPMVLSAAKGFGANGAVDQIEVLSADATGIVTLPASNLSYIYRAIANAWGSTIAPPQYGNTYNQSAQSCLSLNNISTDDFGNTWTNNAVTFTNVSPMIAGTYMGVFNGTSSYMRTTAITSLGSGGWTLRGKVKATNTALAATIINAGVAGTWGVLLAIQVTSGKLLLSLSSNGTSADITSATVGNTALVSGTAYDWEITYDQVAGKYYTYLNGVAESNLTITSSSKICGISNITLGANSAASPAVFLGGNIQGFEFLPYCLHPAGTSFTPPTTLANVSAAGYASDWFDLNSYTMKSVSAASASAGVNPTFTGSAKVYVAESVTGAATVTSVTNYAYQGRYDSGRFTIAASTTYNKNHNIGVVPGRTLLRGALSAGGQLGDFANYYTTAYGGAAIQACSSTGITVITQSSPRVWSAPNTPLVAVEANIIVERGW